MRSRTNFPGHDFQDAIQDMVPDNTISADCRHYRCPCHPGTGHFCAIVQHQSGCGTNRQLPEYPRLNKAFGRFDRAYRKGAREWDAEFAGFQPQSGMLRVLASSRLCCGAV
jgi:hypothetical protein